MSRTIHLASLLVVVALLMLWGTSGSVAQAANNSEQVVFSGTGFSATIGPFGFWIWCEADSSNPYVSECNGAMYFYALFPTMPTKHVDGTISEGPEGIYTMRVASRDGSVACTLKNEATPPTPGPTNKVSVKCCKPSFSGESTNAVVNVTGP